MELLHQHNRLANRQAGLNLLDFWTNRAKTLPKESTGLDHSNNCFRSVWVYEIVLMVTAHRDNTNSLYLIRPSHYTKITFDDYLNNKFRLP